MRRHRIFILIWSVFVWGIISSTAKSSEPIQLVTLDYPPYEYTENDEVKGLAVNVVREIFRRLDHKVEISVLPWARSLKLVERGEVDGIFTIYKTSEREQFLDYSNEVLMDQEVSLFVRKGFPVSKINQLTDLAGYNFGARIGVSYGEKFDQADADGTLREVHRVFDGDMLVKLLINSRIDVVPFNRLGGFYRFERMGVRDKLVEIQPPIQSVPSFIAFSKRRHLTGLRDQVDTMLKEMKADGSYQILTSFSPTQ
ncbi:substrate-binding periplasmic protein [Kiloniella antarctica]|uniref:Substrate-binding periplasmic protein n=1 Tax=Kiloniella antarctica TaxID=1550907 RepID=A0ABW5BJ08_9PROT